MAELEHESYEHVAPAGAFRWLAVQRGPGVREAKVFGVDRGRIAFLGGLRYPPTPRRLAACVRAMDGFLARGGEPTREARWDMGLVSHYLFSGPDRRGLMIRWVEPPSPQGLGEAIEGARETLHLRPPPKRKPKSDAAVAEGGGSSAPKTGAAGVNRPAGGE
jgi:hypothetical protein